MSSGEKGSGLLEQVAEAARLAEGPEGVRRVLRAVFRNGPVPIRDVARDVLLPVPVVAAVRGELEKRGLLTRKGGIALTETGLAWTREDLGISSRKSLYTSDIFKLPPELAPALRSFEEIAGARPDVDVRLDQSHALPLTALKRACYLFEHDALEGRRVLILGDDDLTSVALSLVARELDLRLAALTICEVDGRLCEYLREALSTADCAVEVVETDLREVLPRSAAGNHDVFFTDPPYTLPGLSLFVSRGIQGLQPLPGKQGYISFGCRRPTEAAEAVRLLAEAGLAPVEIVPNFNQYVGAQLLAGRSQMIRTVTTGLGAPPVDGPYDGPLYTADRRRKV